MVRLAGKNFKAQPSENLLHSKPPVTPISGVAVFQGRGDAWWSADHYKFVKAHATEGQYCVANQTCGGKPGWRLDGGLGMFGMPRRLFGMGWVASFLKSPDWSGYDYLWLDVATLAGTAFSPSPAGDSIGSFWTARSPRSRKGRPSRMSGSSAWNRRQALRRACFGPPWCRRPQTEQPDRRQAGRRQGVGRLAR